jgi:hypothetical protein
LKNSSFGNLQGFNSCPFSELIELSGFGEIIFGGLFLIFRQSKLLHYFNIIAMLLFLLVVAIVYPHYFAQGFNPFIMNTAMAALSIVAIQLFNAQKFVNLHTHIVAKLLFPSLVSRGNLFRQFAFTS